MKGKAGGRYLSLSQEYFLRGVNATSDILLFHGRRNAMVKKCSSGNGDGNFVTALKPPRFFLYN